MSGAKRNITSLEEQEQDNEGGRSGCMRFLLQCFGTEGRSHLTWLVDIKSPLRPGAGLSIFAECK